VIFRFNNFEEVQIQKSINCKPQGLKYKYQRPTSVEFTEAELRELMTEEGQKKLADILVRMEKK